MYSFSITSHCEMSKSKIITAMTRFFWALETRVQTVAMNRQKDWICLVLIWLRFTQCVRCCFHSSSASCGLILDKDTILSMHVFLWPGKLYVLLFPSDISWFFHNLVRPLRSLFPSSFQRWGDSSLQRLQLCRDVAIQRPARTAPESSRGLLLFFCFSEGQIICDTGARRWNLLHFRLYSIYLSYHSNSFNHMSSFMSVKMYLHHVGPSLSPWASIESTVSLILPAVDFPSIRD